MGGKEAVIFRLVRAENVYGFNGKSRNPLRKSKIEAKVMTREKKEVELLCRVGRSWRPGQGDPSTAPWSSRAVIRVPG